MDELAGFLNSIIDTGIRCYNCGHVLSSSSDTCPSCGCKEHPVCHHCSAQIRFEYIFCPQCGKKLHQPSTCPFCGKKLNDGICSCGKFRLQRLKLQSLKTRMPLAICADPGFLIQICSQCSLSYSINMKYCVRCGKSLFFARTLISNGPPYFS